MFIKKNYVKYFFILIMLPWLMSFTNKTAKPLTNLPKYYSYGNVVEVLDLYDINDNLRFHYVRFDDSYLIYDLKQDKYVEFNHSNFSPYDDFKTFKIIYNGLNGYFYSRDNSLFDCLTNEQVSKEKLIYGINDSSKQIIERDIPNPHFEIPYSRYFKNLDGVVNKFPLNKNGDCGYVASSLLLGYYANFVDPRLSCKHYMYTPSTNDVSDMYKYVTCFNQDFKDTVLKQPSDKNATIAETMEIVINRYISTTAVSNEFKVNAKSVTTESFIKNFLYESKPVLIFDNYKNITDGSTISKHVVLAYGITDNNNFICHLGYRNQSYVELDSSLLPLVWGRLSIEYTGNYHQHGSFHLVNNRPYCLVCSKYVDPLIQHKYSHYDEHVHKVTCDLCNKIDLEQHSYVLYNMQYKKCVHCCFLKKFNEGELIVRP